jgi:alpha-amylase
MGSGDQRLIDDWRKLTTSDHAYYMCTKYWNDGDVHAYFSPYESPYDAFMYFMNVLRDMKYRIEQDKVRHDLASKAN